MRIVVTGAAGYIGSSLCRYIVNKFFNAQVIAFDNMYFNQDALAGQALLHPRIYFYRENVLGWSSNLRNAVDNADYIIPLAALVGAPLCEENPAGSRALNYEWFEDLLNKIHKKTRIIYPNTNSGYGTTGKDVLCTEETPLNPISQYGIDKQRTESLLMENHKNTICFRLATAFGVSPRQRLDLLVNFMTWKAVTKGKLDIFDGNARRNYICIDDICSAFCYAMENSSSMVHNIYNLGADTLNCTKIELAHEISTMVDYELFNNSSKSDPDKRDYVVSSQKLYDTGWYPDNNSFILPLTKLIHYLRIIRPSEEMFNYDRK